MSKNKYKEQSLSTPIEYHETAAWADINKTKPVSNVSMPSKFNVLNAKDWVEENKK